MKVRMWFLVFAIAVVFLYVAVIRPARERSEKRRRAELYLLDTIKGGVSQYLDGGGQLPTNWVSVSNSVDWHRISGISEFNHLSPPEEMYTVLVHAVTNVATGECCFLLTSAPTKWPAQGLGRWALVIAPIPMSPDRSGAKSGNRILRTWIPEDRLSPEILSQIASRPKR